ncbi:MAG: hypothetical protein J5675_04390 [Bacteroidales bacterium]|nr:hypothetical protein [Bacteroidales bacterium]
MRKLYLILAVSALAALVACQRENEVVQTPGENGVTEVTTQFVLNVGAAPKTKMTADVVQQDGHFRGLEKVKILTYKTGMEGTPYVLNTSAPAAGDAKEFDLGLLFGSDGLQNGDSNSNNVNDNLESSSRRVLQLSIPVGTDAVLIYGKATKDGNAKDEDFGSTYDYNPFGASTSTESSIGTTPSNTVFAAHNILAPKDTALYKATADLMILIINQILHSSVEAGSIPSWGDVPALSWADLGHQYEINTYGTQSRYSGTASELIGLEEILGKSYYAFTYIRPIDSEIRPKGEYRGGSSNAIRTMVMDMYKVVSATAAATPTNKREANALRLAETILDNALLFFVGPNEEGKTPGEYRGVTVIKDKLSSYNLADITPYANVGELNSFPFGDFGLPEGAAQLGFNVQGGTYAKDEFYYYRPNKPLVNPNMTDFDARKYLYPAELWYYVNSPIRTTSKSTLLVSDFPNGVNNWDNEGSWSADWTTPGKVLSSTRGVAVKDDLNYGVALMKSSVIYNTNVLKDNRAAMTNNAEQDREIDIDDADIELRGILVGGVNPVMNWQFTRYYTTSTMSNNGFDLSKFDGVIYDHSMASSTVPTPTNKENYTLVYDNYNSSGDQNDVYVALEFVNNGDDFWGRDNLIRSGGVFYLVAMLPKPTTAQASALTWPTNHQVPPLNGLTETNPGTSKKVARVFIQDFMTSVTFRIGEQSLKRAYYSVPDLRASQMSLGLSVDLQWTPGLSYPTVDL